MVIYHSYVSLPEGKFICCYHPTPHVFGEGFFWLHSSNVQYSYGKSLFLIGKLTISMAVFNSYVKSPEGSGFRQIYGDFSHDSKQQKGDVHQEFLWNSRNRNGNFSHKELSHRNGE
jgi:hypothetical protein